jgi:hypothetical protein
MLTFPGYIENKMQYENKTEIGGIPIWCFAQSPLLEDLGLSRELSLLVPFASC